MKQDYIEKEMDELGADGVDFVPICSQDDLPVPVIASYTKKEWDFVHAYPKTNRIYWKMLENGEKQYLTRKISLEMDTGGDADE